MPEAICRDQNASVLFTKIFRKKNTPSKCLYISSIFGVRCCDSCSLLTARCNDALITWITSCDSSHWKQSDSPKPFGSACLSVCVLQETKVSLQPRHVWLERHCTQQRIVTQSHIIALLHFFFIYILHRRSKDSNSSSHTTNTHARAMWDTFTAFRS